MLGYWRCHLWRVDWWFWWYYSGYRAYRYSLRGKKKLERKERHNFLYGETPWGTFAELLSWVGWSKEHHFLELGAGTGRLSVLLAYCGAQSCTAIELLSPFASRAVKIARRCGLHNAEIIEKDMLLVSWAEADLIYLTATAFDEDMMAKISDKCSELKSGAQLLSLTQAPSSEDIEVIGHRMCQFSWGMATVYWCRRR